MSPSLQIEYVDWLLGGSFSAQGYTGYTFNFTNEAQAYNNVPVLAGFEWKLPGVLGSVHHISLTSQEDMAFINSAGLNLFSFGTSLGLKKTVFQSSKGALDLMLPVGYRGYPGVQFTSSADVRDGLVLSPGLLHRHNLGIFSMSEFSSFQHQFASGPNYRSNVYTLMVSGATQLPHQSTAQMALGYAYSNYPEAATGRTDSRFNLGIEVSKKITLFRPVNASVGYGFERNDSSVSLATYAKHTISLKVTYAIQ